MNLLVLVNRPISIYLNSASNNRPQYEVLGNTCSYRVCGVYSPEPRAEVYCVRLNVNISKLVYSPLVLNAINFS